MTVQLPEQPLDFQQVWQMFVASDAKLTRMFAETDAKLARSFAETDAKLARSFAETRAQIAATNQQIKETNQRVGDLTSKWGQFVEGLVAPATLRLFAARGISLDGTTQRAKRLHNGQTLEIDILAVNGEYVVLIEVKSTLKVVDVQDHMQQLAQFKTFFREYADRKVLGAVAGIVIDSDADKFAYKQGLFVIVQSGDLVKIANDAKFRPKVW